MSLSRQLMLVILALLCVMYVGTFGLSLNNTYNYLTAQLESHAQDAATSLGLSLSPYMEKQDIATMEAMVNSIFDRGYYRQVTVESVDGKTLIDRTYAVSSEGVPSWFIGLIPLSTPQGESLIMAGWSQAGTVRVSSHPGYAYSELWHTAVDTSRWFAVCGLAFAGLSLFLLKTLLKPLQAIEVQAEAICNRDYQIQHQVPRTREMRQVVLAMNKVSQKVRQMFDEQSSLTESLRSQAYLDPVTHLGNRRYFDMQLQHCLESLEAGSVGGLVVLQLNGFKEYNDTHGFQAGDELLRRVGELIRSHSVDVPGVMHARLSGAEYAVLVPKTSREQTSELCARLALGLRQLEADRLSNADEICHVGGTLFTTGEASSAVLAHADQSLRAAQSRGGNCWSLFDLAANVGLPEGAQNWRTFLQGLLANKSAVLHFQPVAAVCSEDVKHYEALLRLTTAEGQLLAAGAFVPMAERLGLTTRLDKLTVAAIVDQIHRDSHVERTYAVNLSASSLADQYFLDWLLDRLHESPDACRRLIFEVPEYGVLRNLETFRAFVNLLQPLGCRFCIDHFGRGLTSFSYLRSARVEYIKIDGSYVRGIDSSKDTQFFVQALAKTAHELDIQVIAGNVETKEELEALKELYIDGARGFYIGGPSASLE